MSNTLTEAQINSIYEADLGRAAASNEQAAWFALDSSGTLNDSQVIAGIVNSAEAVGSGWEVVRLYQSAFNRIPDGSIPPSLTGGYQVNTAAIDSFAGGKISELQLAADFVAEQEFINHYGNLAGQTTTSDPSGMAIFIQALYLNDLGRTGSAAEVNAWLATGDSAAQVLIGFSDSTEFQNKVNPTVAALLTTNANDAIATPATTALTGVGPLTPPAVQVFNLTIAVDNFTATTSNATFNALPFATAFGTLVNTLNSGDNLQDPTDTSTLNYTSVPASAFLASNPPYVLGVTINGVKTLNFTNDTVAFAGFQGTVTGLQTVNDTASVGPLELGFTGQGIDATGPVVSTVNVAGFAGSSGSTIYWEQLAAAAGSASNSLSVTLSGALGTAKFADVILVATDGAAGTATAPNLAYGTQTYTVNSNANLQMGSGGPAFGGASVDGTTAFVFKGTGNLAIGQDFIGDHQKVASIDASGDSGVLWITGGAAGLGGNAQASATNPGGLFGSAVGFLNDATGFGLTSFKEGTGVTNLDVSSASVANMGALTTVANAGNTLTNNMIIVSSAVADTVLSSTFATIAGFQVLGVAGAGGDTGTISMTMLPTSINDIFLETTQVGALTINNPVSALTVDLESNSGAGVAGNVTVGTVGPQSGTTASLDWIVGDTGTKVGDAAGALTSFGYESVTITANGGTDSTGLVSLSPNPLGAESVTIAGNQSIGVGSPVTFLGAVAALNVAGTALLTPGLFTSLNITDTGATKFVTLWGDAFFGPAPLVFQTGGVTAPFIGYSTNAQSIHDTGAAGLQMQAGDANFTVGATVATSAGDTITGSLTAANVLVGSLGNDTITGNTSTAPTAADTIVTNGGADTVTLGLGHTASDHVDVYSGFNFTAVPTVGGGDLESSATVFVGGGTIVGPGNKAQVGWWGVATGAAAPVTIAASTSADQSTIANFLPGTKVTPQDQVVFSVSAWDATAPDIGLVNGGLTTAAVGPTVATVNTGGTLVGATSDLIIENTTTFGSAAAVATAITTAASAFTTTAGFLAGDHYHFLVAYQDLSNNTHIMDLNITGVLGGATTVGQTALGSDMVQLTGVPLATLLAEAAGTNYVHIVA